MKQSVLSSSPLSPLNYLKPYKILWWIIPLTFTPVILSPDGAFDLQFHDTYFVFVSLHVAIVFSLFLGFLGGIYWLLRAYHLINILSLTHAFTTSIAMLGIVLIAICQNIFRARSYKFLNLLNSIGFLLIAILIIIQLIFIINIIIGLVKGRKENPKKNKWYY